MAAAVAGPSSSSSAMARTPSSSLQGSSSLAGPSTAASVSAVTLTSSILGSLQPSKVFAAPAFLTANEGHSFTSIDFDDRGEHCVSSATDDTMRVWDVRTGRHSQVLYSKKYGAHLIRFSHSSSAVIYASTKGDDTIRYHSLHDNRYLQYFRGHTAPVVSLQMSPCNDTFLSGALSDSVKLWDLRSPNAEGSMSVTGHPTVAFDPSGEVFALGLSDRMTILLYSRQQFNSPPFMSILLDDAAYLSSISMPPRHPLITSLKFSPASSSGHLLVGTSCNQHYIVDTWSNSYRYRLMGHEGLERIPSSPADILRGDIDVPTPSIPSGNATPGSSGEELTWSPCGKFVLAASANGQILIWELPISPPDAQELQRQQQGQQAQSQPSSSPPTLTLTPTGRLDIPARAASNPTKAASAAGGTAGSLRALAFSPRTAVLASAGAAVTFWLPSLTTTAAAKTSSS